MTNQEIAREIAKRFIPMEPNEYREGALKFIEKILNEKDKECNGCFICLEARKFKEVK